MRVLCDQTVNERYVETLDSDPDHVVARARDALQPDASDDAVASYATVAE